MKRCWVVLLVWTSARSVERRFSLRILPDQREYMLSPKLLVDIGVDMFINPQYLPLILLESLFPSFCCSCKSTPESTSFFTLKTIFLQLLRPFHFILFRAKLWVMIRRQAISTATAGPPVPAAKFTPSFGLPSIGFCWSFRSEPPMATAADSQKTVYVWASTLYFLSKMSTCGQGRHSLYLASMV